MVEHVLGKDEVTGSIPVVGLKKTDRLMPSKVEFGLNKIVGD
jgi:hypothetical protein